MQGPMWWLVCLSAKWIPGDNSSFNPNTSDKPILRFHFFNDERIISSPFQQSKPVELDCRRHFRRIFLSLHDSLQKGALQPAPLNQNHHAKSEGCCSIFHLDFLWEHRQLAKCLSPSIHQRDTDDSIASDHFRTNRRLRRGRLTPIRPQEWERDTWKLKRYQGNHQLELDEIHAQGVITVWAILQINAIHKRKAAIL